MTRLRSEENTTLVQNYYRKYKQNAYYMADSLRH